MILQRLTDVSVKLISVLCIYMKHIYRFITPASVAALYVQIRRFIEEKCDVNLKLYSTIITSPTVNYVVT